MEILSGRGLWYGADDGRGGRLVFSETVWEETCRQAVEWGIRVVHPKVADGGYLWYDTAGLLMLKRVADQYGVVCAPYHYCYGDHYGALQREAQICAGLGGFFGAVCPDIEIEWEVPQAGSWARAFGETVRATYSGAIYPTVFANPDQHALPWLEMNEWATAFLPQVYFSVWTPPTAQNGISYVYPQWLHLAERAKSGGKELVPMLPVISLENGVGPGEVADWIKKMQHYGYCGFWYEKSYAPYASTIKNLPVPALLVEADKPPVIVTPPIVHPAPVASVVPIPVPAEAPVGAEPVRDSKPVVGDSAGATIVSAKNPDGSRLSGFLPFEPIGTPSPSGAPVIVTSAGVPLATTSNVSSVIPQAPAMPQPPTAADVQPVSPAEVPVEAQPTGKIEFPVSLPPLPDSSRLLVEIENTGISDALLQELWGQQKKIPWDGTQPVVQKWMDLVRRGEFIGIPLDFVAIGQKATGVTFTSGRCILYFSAARTICVL